MAVNLIKFIDKYIGTPLCLILGLFNRKQKISKNKLKNICFLQLWGIGETITTLPAIKAVKHALPKTNISVICTNRVKEVFIVQKFINTLKIISLNPFSILFFMLKNRKKFDLVIDFEEYLNISAIISFFIGTQRIGYSNQIRSRLYNFSIPYNDKQHVSKTHLDLLQGLGIRKSIDKLEPVNIKKESNKKISSILKELKINKHFLIGLAPGAAESSRSRMWPLSRFAKTAEYLIDKYNAKIILIGNKKEVELCKDLLKLVNPEKRKNIFNLAGKTSIQEFFALIQKLNLLISNDAGAMHIGASLSTKTIGLFGPNLPLRFGAFGKHCINIYKGEVCRFSPCINVHKGQVPECLWGKKHQNYKICMRNIEISDVKRAVEMLV